MNIEIRKEKEGDYRETEGLVRDSFWNVYRPGCNEHLILHKFRDHEDYLPDLSYIMTDDGKIIAQIMFSVSWLTNDVTYEKKRICTFGPVSVHPEHQKKGYGKKIIEFGIRKASETGFEYTVIFGDPKYYSGFGFEAAALHGVYTEGQEKDKVLDFVMIKDLTGNGYAGLLPDTWTYNESSGFMTDEKELEEFDSGFPYRKKEVREGQL